MTDPYASVASNYDIMIDWPARLARERPFFAQLFAERPVRRVLDVGCGTGHHSRLFAELGAEVIGLDPSLAMLARAKELTVGANPRFIEGGFNNICTFPGAFDLIAVLGNTLAYARDEEDLASILHAMRRELTQGGRLVIQVVNYDTIFVEESRWLPLIHRVVDGREYLFLREYRRMGRQVEFTITTLIHDGEWTRSTERSMHFAITGNALTAALARSGYATYELYGDYQQAPYDPASSPSLLAVAESG